MVFIAAGEPREDVVAFTRHSRGTHAVLTRHSRGTHAVLTHLSPGLEEPRLTQILLSFTELFRNVWLGTYIYINSGSKLDQEVKFTSRKRVLPRCRCSRCRSKESRTVPLIFNEGMLRYHSRSKRYWRTDKIKSIVKNLTQMLTETDLNLTGLARNNLKCWHRLI